MTRLRIAAWGLGLAAVLMAVLALALWFWLPGDEALARRLETEVQARTGVQLHIGQASWRLLPMPSVSVRDVRTLQATPITIEGLVARPRIGPLLHGQLVFAVLELDGVMARRESLRALRGKLHDDGTRPEAATPPDAGTAPAVPLERVEFRNLTWVSHSGIAVAYDGEIDFDPLWRPRVASLRVARAEVPAVLELQREGSADRWQARVTLGGGTAHGWVALDSPPANAPGGVFKLVGELMPRDIEVSSTLAAFNRRSPLSGKASGRTVLSASGKTAGELGRSLHTTSDLSVASGVVLRLDLDRAIRTAGKEHQGQTALDSLSGRMETQNTEDGVRFSYSGVKATAGRYTASGEAVVYQRQVQASGTLDIVDGLIGVPFTASGPVQKPKVSVPPGFYAGAAIGTVLLPGVGTVIGARIGGALGRVFGGKPQAPASGPAPAPAPRGPQSTRP